MNADNRIRAANLLERVELTVEMVDELVDTLLESVQEGREDQGRIAEILAQSPHLAQFIILELANRVV